jgi:AcrB/AcrD/AcrF family
MARVWTWGDDPIMRDPRYNIASMLGAISFVAVGIVALREANDEWDSGLFSLTLGLLLNAMLLLVHRNEARRAFWIGFALFGWGYLSVSLISSIEPRLITTQALVSLEKANILGNRGNVMRVIPDLDRMRAHNLSLDDLLKATEESRWDESPEQEQLRRRSRTLEYVRGSYVLSLATARFNKPEQYGRIVLKASPDGEILWLKDVATVRPGSSLLTPGGGTGTTENFVRIGHSLFALIVGCLGGSLSRKFRPPN